MSARKFALLLASASALAACAAGNPASPPDARPGREKRSPPDELVGLEPPPDRPAAEPRLPDAAPDRPADAAGERANELRVDRPRDLAPADTSVKPDQKPDLGCGTAGPYPCPGSFGTLCGGSTYLICQTGLACATFSTGSTGFCTPACTTLGASCSNGPPGATAVCTLSDGSGKHFCGFECFPGVCPKGLSCDFSEKLCKP